MTAGSRSRVGVAIISTLALCLVVMGATSARAQLLYSYESGLEGWSAVSATLTNSTTLGVTDGLQSMLIDNLPPNFNNDAGVVTHCAGCGAAFNAWDAAAMAIEAGETDVKLEFDFSYDHTNVIGPEAFAQLGMFVNSTGAAFKQYGTGGLIGGNIGGLDAFPRLDPAAIADGVTLTNVGPNTIHLAIPMGPTKSLNIGGGPAGTNFYQMGFKTNGGWGGSVDWAIDNVRISGAVAPTTSETLFSWETLDDPGTLAVDERFEGWLPGNFANNPPHMHSIVTTGATDGTHALQIDRTNLLPPAGSDPQFTWGSLYTLNSDTDPDPMVENIDPAIQAKIDSLITKVEAADRVAFDVTYKFVDQFPDPVPSYTNFTVHFSDEAGVFYQATGPGIAVTSTTQQTSTIVIPLANFIDANNNTLTLKNDGFVANSNFFRIGLGSATDANQTYQIDNFRLLTVVLTLGDYNNNGTVDAADYVVWRENVGTTNALPNDSIHGTVGQGQYDQWRANFGKSLGSGSGSENAVGSAAVPEPTSAAFAIALIVAGLLTFRRGV